jgi:hypothetical protein
VDGKIFVPEGDQGVVQKRPNPWAHEATGNTGNARSSYREGEKVKVRRLDGLDADAEQAKRLEVFENERAQVKAFWIPAHTPGADIELKKPTTKGQKHPWGEYSLKFKNLIPVKFTPVDSSKVDADKQLAASSENRFMCPVTFKTFGRATKAAVLKPSGHVVHASVIKDYIEKFGARETQSPPAHPHARIARLIRSVHVESKPGEVDLLTRAVLAYRRVSHLWQEDDEEGCDHAQGRRDGLRSTRLREGPSNEVWKCRALRLAFGSVRTSGGPVLRSASGATASPLCTCMYV